LFCTNFIQAIKFKNCLFFAYPVELKPFNNAGPNFICMPAASYITDQGVAVDGDS